MKQHESEPAEGQYEESSPGYSGQSESNENSPDKIEDEESPVGVNYNYYEKPKPQK